jgi:hypothetical protein
MDKCVSVKSEQEALTHPVGTWVELNEYPRQVRQHHDGEKYLSTTWVKVLGF